MLKYTIFHSWSGDIYNSHKSNLFGDDSPELLEDTPEKVAEVLKHWENMGWIKIPENCTICILPVYIPIVK
jgi:hypothetical protein